MAFTKSEIEMYAKQGLSIDESGTLIKYFGNETSVLIPEGVVTIGRRAFQGCKKICEVIIPLTVKRIEAQAFMECSQLQTMNIPNSVQEVGAGAFFKCIRLMSVHLPEGLTEISDQMFCYCRKLEIVAIPNSVIKIGQSVFWECKCLTGFVAPLGLTFIGDTAFTLCEKLKTIILSPVLSEIGREAFSATKPSSISIPATLKKIGNWIFRECDKLKVINYEGTKEQWNNIEKGEKNDYSDIIEFNVPFNYDALSGTKSASNTACRTEQPKAQAVKNGDKLSKSSTSQKTNSTPLQMQRNAKTVADEHNIATDNTEVLINSDIVVTIPNGMLYSTNKEEVSSDTAERCLVFYKEEQNDYYVSEHEVEEYNFADPFAAPQCLTMRPVLNVFGAMGVDFDLDNPAILSQLREVINTNFLVMSSDVQTVLESSDMLIYYANNLLTENMFMYAIVTHKGIYRGQIWVNDVDSKQKRTKILKSWLKNIKLESPKVPSRLVEPIADISQEQQTFVMPTFSGKRANMGELTIAVPDGMMTLDDFDADELPKIREQFAMIIVPQGSEDNFDNYLGSICSISCKKEAINRINLDGIWDLSEDDVKSLFVSSMVHNFDSDEEAVYYQRLSDRLVASFAPLNEGVDDGKFWCIYKLVCFCESNAYLATVCFNAKDDRATFIAFLKELVATIEYKSAEDKKNFEREHAKRQLGEFASEDGKLNAIKFTSLLARDVIFWERNEATFDGEHHKLTAIRTNRKMQSQYSMLNNQTVHTEMSNLTSFVEQNKNLIIPIEFYCEEFKTIYNNEPITGITALQLCMDHFLEVVERSPDNYIVSMDVHLQYGIPECYKYVGELIKTLRAYNGKYGGFTYTVILVKTMEVNFIPLSRPVVGAAKSGGNTPITVNEGESPYSGVIDNLKK